jgi:outer membrane protein assembly factor BamD
MMVKKLYIRAFCFGCMFLISLSACMKKSMKADLTPEDRMATAMRLYEKHDYLDAKTQFRIITLSYGGSTVADKAQYFLSECHFFLKEYILAASEYERLMKVFPNSEFMDDSKYKLGLCYYKLSPKYSMDQEYTTKAIKEFQEFLEDYDSSTLLPEVESKLEEAKNKLAQKVYASGELYRKMGYYEAAIVYFNLVLEHHYTSKFAPAAQFWLGECYFRDKKFTEAKEAFEVYLARYSRHEFISRAKARLASIPKEQEKQIKETLKKQAQKSAMQL